jgi:long-chain acyl-CoA synthetase
MTMADLPPDMPNPESPLVGDLAAVSTLAELLTWRIARSPRGDAYRQHDDAAQRWTSITWHEFGARVSRFAAALDALHLPRGARVAVLLPNGIDAVCIDQAALALACVPVPMHAIDNPRSIAYILRDSEAVLLIAQSEAQWQAILATAELSPSLRQVVVQQREPSSAPVAPPWQSSA